MKRLLQLLIAAHLDSAQAQVDRAVLTGTVKDEQGRHPRASLAVTHSGTNVATRVVTTADGVYLAPNLIPGTYTVVAEASASLAVARRDPEVGQRARIDFT